MRLPDTHRGMVNIEVIEQIDLNRCAIWDTDQRT